MKHLKLYEKQTWTEKEDQLYRKFEFASFSEAFSFMKRVADLAERADHHPTWKGTERVVEIWLSTHSKGKVTQRDLDLAREIDKVY